MTNTHVKKVYGPTIKSCYDKIKEEYGEDAVVIRENREGDQYMVLFTTDRDLDAMDIVHADATTQSGPPAAARPTQANADSSSESHRIQSRRSRIANHLSSFENVPKQDQKSGDNELSVKLSPATQIIQTAFTDQATQPKSSAKTLREELEEQDRARGAPTFSWVNPEKTTITRELETDGLTQSIGENQASRHTSYQGRIYGPGDADVEVFNPEKHGRIREKSTAQGSAVPYYRSKEEAHGANDREQNQENKLIDEVSALRRTLSSQINNLTWKSNLETNPAKGMTWASLTTMGFSPEFARSIIELMPATLTENTVMDWLDQVLLSNITCPEPGEDLVSTGGVFAFVGPTGVGKTTSVAKMAARCIAKNGMNSVGLITIDTNRVAAQDQLKLYGKILGVQVFAANDVESLRETVKSLSTRHLVLIDCGGLSQNDVKITEQNLLLDTVKATPILVLNSAAQTETLDEVAHSYEELKPAGCIITKIDEAAKIGGALDVIIRYQLPIHYLSTGQTVPDDFILVKKRDLIAQAKRYQPNVSFSESTIERDWKRNLILPTNP